MPNEHSFRHVNALDMGVIPGTGKTAAVRTNNSDRVYHWAQKGYSVYFPNGEYEFNSILSWVSGADYVKVWGDNAKLYQMTDDTQLLDFTSVTHLEVTGLHLHSAYHGRQTATSHQETESMLVAYKCDQVNIHNNVFQGFNAYALLVWGGRDISITGNKFRDGNWDATYVESSDIRIEPVTGADRAQKILISGNHCNTKSLVGIASLYPARDLICTDNFVICQATDGTDVTTYSASQRKEGIQLQYYLDTTQGNDELDSDQYEMTITGNTVTGCRFAGISCQASTISTANEGGIRGAIANNKIRYCGTEQVAATSRVQGGIIINQYRDVTITGNVIKNIYNDVINSYGCSAIHVENTEQLSAATGGTLSSCTITGNIITDCESRGINIYRAGDITCTGNIVRDCLARNFYVYDDGTTRGGNITVVGNRFVSTLGVDESMFRVEGVTGTSNFNIASNHFEYTGTFSADVGIVELYNIDWSFTGNRVIGAGSATTSIGLHLRHTQTQRCSSINIADNHFEDCGDGLRGAPAATIGPVLYSNCSFNGCGENVRAADRNELFSGHWVVRSDGTDNQTNAIAYSDATPTQGNWILGDVVWQTKMTSSNPMGWVCTTAGSPGTWTALPNAF